MDTPAPPTVPARLGPDGDALLRGIPIGVTVVSEPAPGRMTRWLAASLVEAIGAPAVRLCFAHGNGRNAMAHGLPDPSVRTHLTVASLVRMVDDERPSAVIVADVCAYDPTTWARRLPSLMRHVHERGMRLLLGLNAPGADDRADEITSHADVLLSSWEAQGPHLWLCARNRHGLTGSFALELRA